MTIDPEKLKWAGIAVLKNAHQVFKKRGYRSTLLGAAYRHAMHWSELIGENVILSMPYKYWKQFESSEIVPAKTLETPVDNSTLQELRSKFPDFKKAYDLDALTQTQFARFEPSVRTLRQFLEGYQDLLKLVRERMLLA